MVAGVFQAVATTFFGVIFAACFIRNNSIWPMIILHAFVDLFATAHDLTDSFGEIHVTTAQNTLVTLIVTLPLFIYGMFILRKVEPIKPLAFNMSAPDKY